jgi:hypothetical protein
MMLTAGIVLLSVFSGCEKDIELELKKEGNKKVLYSFVYPDSALNFHYSKSVDVLSDANFKVVNKAHFKMYINGLYQGEYFFPDGKVYGIWDDFEFSPGDKLVLKAMDDTNDTAVVSTEIPVSVPVEELDTVSSVYQGTDDILYEVLKCNLLFTDDILRDDFYQLVIIHERWEVIDGQEKYYLDTVDYVKDDPVFFSRSQEGTLLEGLDFHGLFDDEIINGSYSVQCLVPSSYYKLFWFDRKIKLTFYLYHHTKDYYRFVRSKLISDYYNGIPVFEPVNIYSNVTNGIGLVSGMSFTTDSLIFEQDLPATK